ncbi:MAG: UbiX family flavin prenyltransferase [Phycisphaeraceae bacterium]|nr:UbiX family flavin prenyltransferase [Phycisphaeraceae bacterium]
MSDRRYIVAITGASGAAYAQRLIRAVVAAQAHVHLVVSPLGQRLLHDELGMEGIDLDALSGGNTSGGGITLHNYRDVGAPMASGSFRHDGMIVIPCSSNTLSAVATSSSANLLHRAAQVTLKERRKLVLLHREMPLSLIDIRNMAAVTEAGAIIAPASPGFYLLPKSIDDLVDFVVARCLDLLGIEHDLCPRWGEQTRT